MKRQQNAAAQQVRSSVNDREDIAATRVEQRAQRKQLAKMNHYDTAHTVPRITFSDIVQGTHNYVMALFHADNMERVLRHMISESGCRGRIGWLPTNTLTEKEIGAGDVEVLARMRQDYKIAMQKQPRTCRVFITNLAVAKTNGQNHYCAFWVDLDSGVVEVWDSATAGTRGSPFSKLFSKAAHQLFVQPPLQLVTVVRRKPGTPHTLAFQHGGGYYGRHGSLLSQNIFCHTWTLFYLELRLNGYSGKEIGCKRGTHPIFPLLLIKGYARCLLARMGVDVSDATPDYRGLLYIWDDEAGMAIRLPDVKAPTSTETRQGSFCAMKAVQNAMASKYYRQPQICQRRHSTDQIKKNDQSNQ